MSRSRRKTPKGGIAIASSEKEFKRQTNQNFRTKQREILRKVKHSKDPDETVFPHKPRDVENPWSGPKDGKSYFGKLKWGGEEENRYFRKLMRK